ncbi:hypothetical protein OPS25_09975 [Alteromonas ponticola]|uniref:Uncharacterized protein n=1 Tax=Alteromonas aquimaris TaxID=2998417 RepID=A0ABT3P7S0_9ALTE|nr:hypothetical protein [Alteromonas aquimaris]MCW8108820.1 hypothetical protein [Alteromonas aquimaris]
MKKLLLASISVVAFASAAVNATEKHPDIHYQNLNTMAYQAIDLGSIKPVIELTETIQVQVDKAFAAEMSPVNKDALLVKNASRKMRKITRIRSE